MVSIVNKQTMDEIIRIIKIKVDYIIKNYSRDKLYESFKISLCKSLIKYLIATLGIILMRYNIRIIGYILITSVLIYNIVTYSINIYKYRVVIIKYIKTKNLNNSITEYLYSEYGILSYIDSISKVTAIFSKEIPEYPIQKAVDDIIIYLKKDCIKIGTMYGIYFIIAYLIIRPMILI